MCWYVEHPLLKLGQYNYLAKEKKTHGCSLDEHVWRVIDQGPYTILDKSYPPQPKET